MWAFVPNATQWFNSSKGNTYDKQKKMQLKKYKAIKQKEFIIVLFFHSP